MSTAQDPNSTRLELPRKLAPLIEEHHRYKIVYGGRGKGATWGFARALLTLGSNGVERIFCCREIQRTIKESVHYALKRQIDLLGLTGFYVVKDNGIVGLNGTEFIFDGLRGLDAAKIKSLEGVTRVWVAEAHVISDNSWKVLIPTIRESGSEIWIEFNPELDTDPTYDRFVTKTPPDSKVIFMSYRDNPWFPDVLEAERQHLYDTDTSYGRAEYNNVWEGKCLPAVKGAIFSNEVAKLFERGRVRPLDYDPKGRVHLVMDLGWGVTAVILVQRFASTVQIIGYREYTHKTYEEITRDLEPLEYRWGKVFMPHDANHRDPKYGKSHFDVMRELGWKTEEIDNVGIENYISLGRDMFANVYISDTEECKRLIHCLRRFKRQIPSTTEHPGAPMKDEFSHGAEVFCYTAVVADQLVNDEPILTDPYRGFASGYAA